MAKGKIIAGIDVGTDKVCTVIASVSDETGKVNVIGVSYQPSKGMKKSQIVNMDDAILSITESVEAAERMAGLSLQSAFVSVGGVHIGCQNSKGVVAVLSPEEEIVSEDVNRVIEAARAVSLPASREVLHVIPKDFIVDSQEGIKDPVGMTGVRLEAEAHIVTAASTATKNLARCISETGINVEGLVFSGLAAASSTLSETERELGVVLVDIGAGSTSICVFVEGSLSHSAVIPVGARNITNDLAIGMRVSLASAEAIKRYLSHAPIVPVHPKKDESRQERTDRKKREDEIDLSKLQLKEDLGVISRKFLIEGIIKPRLVEMFELVGQELKNAGFNANNVPAGIVLTGGGAETEGMVEMCKHVLKMPARVGVPKALSGLVEEIESPAFAASMGLIVYGQKSSIIRSTRSSFVQMPGGLTKLPIKKIINKLVDLIKSFLP